MLYYKNNTYKPKEKMIMSIKTLFPIVLIILDVLAGIVYACHGDIRRTIYWLAASALTACVTF